MEKILLSTDVPADVPADVKVYRVCLSTSGNACCLSVEDFRYIAASTYAIVLADKENAGTTTNWLKVAFER